MFFNNKDIKKNIIIAKNSRKVDPNTFYHLRSFHQLYIKLDGLSLDYILKKWNQYTTSNIILKNILFIGEKNRFNVMKIYSNTNFFVYPGTNSSIHPESSVNKNIITSTLYYYIGNNFEEDYQNININEDKFYEQNFLEIAEYSPKEDMIFFGLERLIYVSELEKSKV